MALHNTSVYCWSYYCSDDGCNSLSLWSLQYDTIQSLHRIATHHHQYMTCTWSTTPVVLQLTTFTPLHHHRHYSCQFYILVIISSEWTTTSRSSHLIFINTIPHYIIHTLLDSPHHTLSTTVKQLDHPFFPFIWHIPFVINSHHYRYTWKSPSSYTSNSSVRRAVDLNVDIQLQNICLHRVWSII